jgi:FtsP/CotA-like multicopper oxidase with cupredoxin domain
LGRAKTISRGSDLRTLNLLSWGLVTRRELLKLSGLTAASVALGSHAQQPAPADYSIEIAPYGLEVAARRTIKTVAYNGQVPGPLLRLKEGVPATIDVRNRTTADDVVHWHGLFLPAQIDGAMEEGTPSIPAGGHARYILNPRPAGFRWYHTHVFAGKDLRKGQYTGEHGFLIIEPRVNPARYDQEIFLALHDWDADLLASADGSMDPAYNVSTINGRVLGFGEPLRVKPGQRVLFHILNSSATEVHWIALAGHRFTVIALDGNPVPQPQLVPMLRLAPAERVSAVVEMNQPGVWVMGEVRKHVMAAGMGIAIEYAGSSGKPAWQQPDKLSWDYLRFRSTDPLPVESNRAIPISLVFDSKFAGHGAMDRWTINGKSYPDTESPILTAGQRYRLSFINHSGNDHPVHLHRHSFELRRVPDRPEMHGIMKDTVLVDARTQLDVEFTANNPGETLFHCHQQNHMDTGFMMLFRYA